MTTVRRNYRYKAFVSYAHEDQRAAAWLRKILRSYWVPGHRRRAIFLDRFSLPAGVLREEIKQALSDSEYLIVCCSWAARDSRWVDQEVDEFLRSHRDGARRVLCCSTGPKGDELVLPASIARLQEAGEGPLFLPDLRGEPWAARGDQARDARREALSLLAPLVGLPSKDALLDSVRRATILLTILAALTTVVGASAIGARLWWLGTPPGIAHTNIAKLVALARTVATTEDPEFLAAAEALGHLDERWAIEPLSNVFAVAQLKDASRAAGYASLPTPDCDAVNKSLEGMDPTSPRIWPGPFLLSQRSCGGDWVSRTAPEGDDPGGRAQWAEALGRSGFASEARAAMKRSGFPRAKRASVETAIAIANVEGDEAIGAPAIGLEDAGGSLYDLLGLLRELDRHGRLSSRIAGELLDAGLEGANGLDDGHWGKFQELAARLAGAGRRDAARQLMSRGGNESPGRTGNPVWSNGWAYRGLALQRLGGEGTSGCLAEALSCARVNIPASRTWQEWEVISEVYAMMGDWRNASFVAEEPLPAFVKFHNLCRLVILWDLSRRRVVTR